MTLPIRDYLQHILDEAEYLGRSASGLTKEQFLNDETLKRAFVGRLEIIGEAVKQIPDETRQKHSQIEWMINEGFNVPLSIARSKALIIKPCVICSSTAHPIMRLPNVFCHIAGRSKIY